MAEDSNDMLSGLPEGVVDDEIRNIDADIKVKNARVEVVDEGIKDTKDRMAVMVEHLKNVQQELVNTQQLCDAKNREVETEEHIKQLASREVGRVLQDMGKAEQQMFELQDRLNLTQNHIFRGNENMDAFKLQMNWNQEEIEQWALAAKQKEEDNLALQKYQRADEMKIKEMNLALEKLTKEVSSCSSSSPHAAHPSRRCRFSAGWWACRMQCANPPPEVTDVSPRGRCRPRRACWRTR